MARRRRSVLLLLLALTVLSPLVLYTRRLSAALKPIQRGDFPGEIANQARGVKASKLNALPLETVSSLKEPVGVVFSEDSRESASTSTESDGQELPLRKAGEHMNRVLSEVTAADAARSKDEGLIEQVTSQEGQDDGSERGSFDQQETAAATQQKSVSEVSSLETVPKQTSANVMMENSLEENKDGMSKTTALPDTRIRNIRDLLIKARVYLGLGAIRANLQYLKDLRQRIREVQKVLGDASKDSVLPNNANEKVKALEQTLIKGKQMQGDCALVVKKLRAMLRSAEE
ncbi:hypothetical protein ABZP36_029469 [Zizania latifolia]